LIFAETFDAADVSAASASPAGRRGKTTRPKGSVSVHPFKELVIMEVKTTLRPQQSAPVHRVNVSDRADLLGELSEESLSGVVASVSVECIKVCICAASGYDDK
jgi:hypothetical protein